MVADTLRLLTNTNQLSRSDRLNLELQGVDTREYQQMST